MRDSRAKTKKVEGGKRKKKGMRWKITSFLTAPRTMDHRLGWAGNLSHQPADKKVCQPSRRAKSRRNTERERKYFRSRVSPAFTFPQLFLTLYGGNSWIERSLLQVPFSFPTTFVLTFSNRKGGDSCVKIFPYCFALDLIESSNMTVARKMIFAHHGSILRSPDDAHDARELGTVLDTILVFQQRVDEWQA